VIWTVTKHLAALLGTVVAARPTTLQSSAMVILVAIVILVIGFMSASLPQPHRTPLHLRSEKGEESTPAEMPAVTRDFTSPRHDLGQQRTDCPICGFRYL
jgi:hypothetical protein